MNGSSTVDVVIDNYNYGRFLRAAIDSALAQREPPAHVIVVDDGSTDASHDIASGYGDRITFVCKENGGQASALNAGWARCTSDIVIFLDADDVLLPHATASVASAFADFPEAVKVQYRLEVIDADGRRTGELKPPPHIRLPSGDLRREELTFPFDLPWMATSGNAFFAAALRRVMPIPEDEFASSADWYLRHLVALLGDVVSLEDVCGCYRVHGGNSYEPARAILDVAHVRKSIEYAAATRTQLLRLADELELPLPPRPLLSVSDQANRLVSRKLEPRAHPLPGDTVVKVALGGVAAAAGRSDVRWPMKLLFAAWFVATAASPRGAASALAEVFLFPERRRRLNPLLGRLARSRRERGGATDD